jgi:indole-3-glycerol phosphate synthase
VGTKTIPNEMHLNQSKSLVTNAMRNVITILSGSIISIKQVEELYHHGIRATSEKFTRSRF